MDVIIVAHTEYGFVKNNQVIADKSAKDGVAKGVPNLIRVAEKYGAKVTFAVMPEVVDFFPKNVDHEIGLHIHPGWQEFQAGGEKFFVGDSYLREQCHQSINSTVLRDFHFREQFDMISKGRDLLRDTFEMEINTFVAGRWSLNNDTVKALIKAGLTHDCSAAAHHQAHHYDWSQLQRICLPYHPHIDDYQKRGDLQLLMVPISQMYPLGNVNPEIEPFVGLPWQKACFLEYYNQNIPLFHICLHSPAMTDPYFIQIMDNLLDFISHFDVNFTFAKKICEYPQKKYKTDIIQYMHAFNFNIAHTTYSNLNKKIHEFLK
jgi:hypothetical protein